MNGIQFIKDENGQTRFVQLDLSIHDESWEDFYDILIAEQRKEEETINFEEVLTLLKNNLNTLYMKSKIAIVTGGASGIGLAITEKFKDGL